MAAEDDDPNSTGIGQILEGGLPQLLLGPAGKAISRLIAGAVDIPSAWLEQQSEKFRDDKNARSTIIKAVAESSGAQAAANSDIVDRAMERFASELQISQKNRETIATETIKLLEDAPPPPESEGPTDDWLNVFQKHAENASSEKLRQTFARVLAGEIRKPGAHSLATLQFLSILDQKTAKDFEAILGWVVDSKALPADFDHELGIELAWSLRDSGIIGQLDSDLRNHKTIDGDGYTAFRVQECALVVEGNIGSAVELPVVSMTRVGQELAASLSGRADEKAIEKIVQKLKKNSHISRITKGIWPAAGNKIEFVSVLWQRET